MFRADAETVPLGATNGAALHRAYELIEAAQDREVSAHIDQLDDAARAVGRLDVRVLLHLARSLAARRRGVDGTAHVQAMLDTAVKLGDPALHALALATTAQRAAAARSLHGPDPFSGEPLASAVVLLDNPHSLLVHRIAASIEVAGAFHALGLWELARAQYLQIEALFAHPHVDAWQQVIRRQQRVVAANRLDLTLDEACGLAEVGEWSTAAAIAAAVLPGMLDILDESWPRSWAATMHAFADLFAALCGQPSPADHEFIRQQAVEPATDGRLSILAVAEAVRARAAGDLARSAQLAARCRPVIGPDVPSHVRLLSLSLAAQETRTSTAAHDYIVELVTLRWNWRLSRLASMQASIDAERRRVENEHLREQVLVDDLTGLGNRRAYSAYLEATRGSLPGLVSCAASRWAGGDRRGPDPEHRELLVMMLDIDHFKAVNDTYGHDIGDEVLYRIGALLAAQVRPVDLAARLGGDEFVVIMAQDDEEVGEARADAIIEAVSTHPWGEVAPGLTISVSLGLHRGRSADLDQLQAEADRQLYIAKRGGRGRIAGRAVPATGRADGALIGGIE